MAFDPDPFNLVTVASGFERLPQVFILHGLFRSGFPAIAFPTVDSLGQAVFDIGAVCVERHLARLFQRVERFNRGHELHAIVRRIGLTAMQLFAVVARDKQRAPAARAWIAATCAVGPNLNIWFCHGLSGGSISSDRQARGAALCANTIYVEF